MFNEGLCFRFIVQEMETIIYMGTTRYIGALFSFTVSDKQNDKH